MPQIFIVSMLLTQQLLLPSLSVSHLSPPHFLQSFLQHILSPSLGMPSNTLQVVSRMNDFETKTQFAEFRNQNFFTYHFKHLFTTYVPGRVQSPEFFHLTIPVPSFVPKYVGELVLLILSHSTLKLISFISPFSSYLQFILDSDT